MKVSFRKRLLYIFLTLLLALLISYLYYTGVHLNEAV